MYTIHLLPGSFGDSILIEYGHESLNYILIDGGPYFAFDEVMPAIQKVAPGLTRLELLVVTHIDIDHIDGVVRLLNSSNIPFEIGEIWFNGWKEIQHSGLPDDLLGAVQGEYLSFLVKKKKVPHNISFGGKAVVVNDFSALPCIELTGGMKLTLLSPDPIALKNLAKVWKKEVEEKIGDLSTIENRLEKDHRYSDLLGEKELSIEALQEIKVDGDKSEANVSSISFIAEFDNKTCLFSGDAPSHVLLKAVDRLLDGKTALEIDAWKIAHHGSKKSTLDSIMQKIRCKRILVSTDGKRYEHPNQETIAKLLKHNGPDLNLFFNYATKFNERWQDDLLQKQYRFQCSYGVDGLISIEL